MPLFKRVPTDRRALGDQSAKLQQSGWWHSFAFPDGERIDGVRSEQELRDHLARFALPDRLDGQRVLDVGAWDGWFSFEMERRGAQVTALDCWDNPNFRRAKAKLGSSVRYVQSEVYDISPATLGVFDIVLFFGVLYHLKHPLLALEKICAVTGDLALIETFVTDESLSRSKHGPPSLEFYETDELSGQVDNWTGPNLACLLAFCRVAGFIEPDLLHCRDHRAWVRCRRTWPVSGCLPGPAPVLEKVEHTRLGGIHFDTRRDEYLTAWFDWDGPAWQREQFRVRIGPFGAIPLKVVTGTPLWQVTAKLPPGLPPGFHPVAVAVDAGPTSNSLEIAVDIREEPESLVITAVQDGRTWETGLVRALPEGTCHAAIWVEGLPRGADRVLVRVLVDEEEVRPEYVESAAASAGPRQVNVVFGAREESAPRGIRVTMGGVASGVFQVNQKS